MADLDKNGQLDLDEFCVAMHLVVNASRRGNPVPDVLPPEIYPPAGGGRRRLLPPAPSPSPPPRPMSCHHAAPSMRFAHDDGLAAAPPGALPSPALVA